MIGTSGLNKVLIDFVCLVPVVGLKNHHITQVAAGEQHSVAVTSYGEVRLNCTSVKNHIYIAWIVSGKH